MSGSRDLVFPVADALSTARIPFVFATGYDRRLIPERYGIIPRWEKPFDLTGLLRSLPAMLEQNTLQMPPAKT